ncbi:antibiotic biosynthesis monooxygenase family protein [Dyella sp. BiH032]|uniref:putative quinol monooxygenase n=1 Tax=Dyella sp. BiH032 TaxID=3075430 RepID=UPI002892EB9D|nr:antibiotic biosynthesis monooxygenase family protein [Dyella sp. BiH032]WNL44791.1 antibiotic biosynthesis monooxygenase family protein [Dyella sp. BiH032]
MTTDPLVLVNLLKVEPGKQAALIALLKQNIDTVIRTLQGWRSTRLIASGDGASVVIYSEWDSPGAVEAMRADPRMKAYFPQILELASLDSSLGKAVFRGGR